MNTKQFSQFDIDAMEQRFRTNFINSISGFKSVALIGTTDLNKQLNLAIFSSIVHIGAHPPLLGFVVRPDSVERHTLENILETKEYTINFINEAIFKKAHQTAARYSKNTSEFDAVGLIPEYSETLKAPYVQESTIKLGLQFVEKVDISINGTCLIIGKIVEVIVPENIIGSDGHLSIEDVNTITVNGLDTYHTVKRIARLTYAKPNSLPQEL
ncbi:MAG: flavin reductase [Bacteroidetes bacterium]|nr:flavin reductase [Bacteroidota bacterium]